MAATPHADQQISQWEYFKGFPAAHRAKELIYPRSRTLYWQTFLFLTKKYRRDVTFFFSDESHADANHLVSIVMFIERLMEQHEMS